MDTYKKLKILSCVLSFALAPFCIYAQEEPATDVSEELVSDAEVSTEQTADSLIQEFLSEKGWAEGENTKKDGSKFFISVGYGTVSAPITHKSYNSSRIRAFDKAMLDAKAKMAETLEQTISASVTSFYEESSGGMTETPDQELARVEKDAPPSGIVDKAALWVSKKLDNALREEGYDIDAEKAKTREERERIASRAKELISTDTFSKSVNSLANVSIAGLQAFYTVEAQNGDKGKVAVVAIWSPALAEMVNAFVSGKPMKGTKAKKTIKEQIPTSTQELLSTFGVQQKINERGEYVLVSFGQAAANSSNSRAERAAYDKARLNAQAQIRQFAGENVAVSRAQEEAEQSLEFDDGGIDYSDEQSYKSFLQSVAKGMVCNGIQSLRNWKAVHPISGKPVFGVICTWSPSQASWAKQTKKKVEAAGTPSKSGVSSGGKAPKKSEPTGVSEFSGAGSAGDEDAF